MEYLTNQEPEERFPIQEFRSSLTRLESRLTEVERRGSEVERRESENLDKMNTLAGKTMQEVIRIEAKVDTVTLETVRQNALHQQGMVAIQDSLSKIISGFGLDRGPEASDALRRDMIWVRDSREASRHSRGIAWETFIKVLIPILMTAMVYGLLFGLITHMQASPQGHS